MNGDPPVAPSLGKIALLSHEGSRQRLAPIGSWRGWKARNRRDWSNPKDIRSLLLPKPNELVEMDSVAHVHPPVSTWVLPLYRTIHSFTGFLRTCVPWWSGEFATSARFSLPSIVLYRLPGIVSTKDANTNRCLFYCMSLRLIPDIHGIKVS